MTLRLGGDGAITGCTSLEEPTISISGLTMTTPIEAVSGTAAAPSYTFSGDTDNGLYYAGTNSIGLSTAGTNAILIDSNGNLGIGLTNPSVKLHADGNGIEVRASNNANSKNISLYGGTSANDPAITFTDALRFYSNSGSAERMRIDSAGHVAIGSTTTFTHFSVVDGTVGLELDPDFGFTSRANTGTLRAYDRGNSVYRDLGITGAEILFGISDTEKMRIDSSGNVKIVSEHLRFNTSGKGIIFGTEGGSNRPSIIGNYTSSTDNNIVFNVTGNERMRIDSGGTVIVKAASADKGIELEANGSRVARFGVLNPGVTHEVYIGTLLGNNLTFRTNNTDRMRLDTSGRLKIGTTDDTPAASNVDGATITADSYLSISRTSDLAIEINRKTSDGVLMRFLQDGTDEGNISISGTTVSYNGGHLSRWSQLASGAERVEILRGSVLSNLDEMCEWGEEDNEQLNRMKVSDVEGDPNVAGIFQGWDDDDKIYTNDFYCAMTGDFVIRIAQGTTVARGDLLMSAGDGTAKPQDDDIIRSKTIAKVTSTQVSKTYADGSYCVPCVLMAC